MKPPRAVTSLALSFDFWSRFKYEHDLIPKLSITELGRRPRGCGVSVDELEKVGR